MRALNRLAIRFAPAFYQLSRVFDRVLSASEPLLKALGYARLEKPVATLERIAKGLVFDCQMCGQCLLSRTGMSCPMNCPKRLRNGPCGGVRPDGTCEVDAKLPCVWAEGWRGIRQVPQEPYAQTLSRPAESNEQGTSAWLRNIRTGGPMSIEPVESEPLASESSLETKLKSGRFVVTSEIAPPDSAELGALEAKLVHFDGHVDALNIIDGAGGNCHMSSIAVAAHLAREGHFEPIMQMTCRDRNRIAIQGDILGAASLGVRNVLCLTGDDVGAGDEPGATPVFDLDSVSLLATLRHMRDKGSFRSGRKLEIPPRLFLGAVESPSVPPVELRADRLAKKCAAGAQFIQTQFCFDAATVETFMQQVRQRGLHERCFILIGVGPVSSARTARWLNDKIPGVQVPEHVIARLEGASDPRHEGALICAETIAATREIDGVAGIHLMAPRQEALVPQILAQAGLSD